MFPAFIRHVVYPLNLARIGSKEGVYLKELEESQWHSPEEIRELQWQKLKKLLEHAYENVPYYRKRFREKKITPDDIKDRDDFLKIPVLTRNELNENLERLKAKNISERQLTLSYSGGSSGEPVSFYKDGRVGEYAHAAVIRHDRWSGWDVGEKIGMLWGAPRDIPEQTVKSRLFNFFLFRRLKLNAFDLNESLMRDYADKLARYKPKILVAYANAMFLFARFVKENDVQGIQPYGIITSAETLFPHQRKLIEDVFDCKVYDRYGSREVGTMASQCPLGGMHVCAEGIYLEIVKNGKPTPPGKEGEILVTDLTNYGMPFIRYAIGDMAVPSDKKCSCGRGLPLIEKVCGRVSDVIVAGNGGLIPGNFFVDLIGRSRMGVEKYQIIQKTKSNLTMRLVKSSRFKSKDLDYIISKIKEKMGDVDIEVEFVEDIKPTKSSKHRFVISAAPNEVSGETND